MDEKINEVVLLRKSGKHYNEINIITGVSYDIIKRICRDHRINNSPTKFKSKNLDKNLVLEKYKELKSLRKTALFFKVSRDTIRKNINDEDIIDYKNRVRKVTPVKAVIEWRKRTKIKLVEYKGGCCVKCGYNKSFNALQFHHLDPKEKDFTISGKSYSFERLKIEVDKCILVCANCHIEIHEELNKI